MGREDTRRQMTALARRWEASGETQMMFAQRHGVSHGKLRYWVQRGRSSNADAIAFTPVKIKDAVMRDAGTIEVSLATGERLVIAADASPDLVRVIVAALRSTC